MQIPSPPIEVNHRARFEGWNFDPRWKNNTPIWNGTGYDLPEDLPKVAKPGQRPIVAFMGGPGDTAVVQFVENDKVIVGKWNIIGCNCHLCHQLNWNFVSLCTFVLLVSSVFVFCYMFSRREHRSGQWCASARAG